MELPLQCICDHQLTLGYGPLAHKLPSLSVSHALMRRRAVASSLRPTKQAGLVSPEILRRSVASFHLHRPLEPFLLPAFPWRRPVSTNLPTLSFQGESGAERQSLQRAVRLSVDVRESKFGARESLWYPSMAIP